VLIADLFAHFDMLATTVCLRDAHLHLHSVLNNRTCLNGLPQTAYRQIQTTSRTTSVEVGRIHTMRIENIEYLFYYSPVAN